MDRLLARLERRLGFLAIPNVTNFLVGGMAIVFVLRMLRPDFAAALVLDFDAVAHGQVWRLVSYLFVPRSRDVLWIILELWFLWMMGTNLENVWGAFKLNIYFLVGMALTTVGAYVTHGAAGNRALIASVLLSFATLFPDYEILLFFVLPVRMKWLGLFTGGLLVVAFFQGYGAEQASILAALATYLLFFGSHLLALLRGRRVLARQAARRESFRPPPPRLPSIPPPSGARGQEGNQVGADAMGQRKCAICGAEEAEGTDIRVCSCAKCGGVPRNLCLAHARNH